MGTNPGKTCQSSRFADKQKRGGSSQAWGRQTWLLGQVPWWDRREGRLVQGTGEAWKPGLLGLNFCHGGLLWPEVAGTS